MLLIGSTATREWAKVDEVVELSEGSLESYSIGDFPMEGRARRHDGIGLYRDVETNRSSSPRAYSPLPYPFGFGRSSSLPPGGGGPSSSNAAVRPFRPHCRIQDSVAVKRLEAARGWSAGAQWSREPGTSVWVAEVRPQHQYHRPLFP